MTNTSWVYAAFLCIVCSTGVEAVDTATLERKMLLGYQGWFACPGDGSAVNRWVHWFRSQTPTAANATVDFLPDISEFEADE